MSGEPQDELYDDEAYIGVEEGLITDGKVLDDLDAEGAQACSPAQAASRQPSALFHAVVSLR